MATRDYGSRAQKTLITDTKHYVPVVTLSAQVMKNYSTNYKQFLKQQLIGMN